MNTIMILGNHRFSMTYVTEIDDCYYKKYDLRYNSIDENFTFKGRSDDDFNGNLLMY